MVNASIVIACLVSVLVGVLVFGAIKIGNLCEKYNTLQHNYNELKDAASDALKVPIEHAERLTYVEEFMKGTLPIQDKLVDYGKNAFIIQFTDQIKQYIRVNVDTKAKDCDKLIVELTVIEEKK